MNTDELLNIDEEVVEPETMVQLFPNLASIDRQKLYVYRILRRTRAAYEDMNVFEIDLVVFHQSFGEYDPYGGS